MAIKIPLVVTNGQVEQLQPGDSIAGGSGTLITKGTTTVNFGAFPGSSDASVVITGQVGILAGSNVDVWITPIATADHSADEHLVETIKVIAGDIIAGVGFTIYAFNTSQVNEPTTQPRLSRFSGSGQDAGTGKVAGGAVDIGGKTPRIYGQFTVAWSWYN